MSKDRPLDLSGFASDRSDQQEKPDRRIAVPPPAPRRVIVTAPSEPEAPPAKVPPSSTGADSADGTARVVRAGREGTIATERGRRSPAEPRPEVGPRPPTSSVRLSVSVPAATRQWLVEQARAVGVVQADILAAALDKHEREVRNQFLGNARWRRGAVPNLTVLGLYLRPVTAERLEQLALDTGAKRSDLVTRILALAMEDEVAPGVVPPVAGD